MYLTYENYTTLGGTLDETTFNDFEFEAESLVNYYTFNRLVNDTEYPEALTRLMYRLIQLFMNKALTMGNTVTDSEGNTISASVTSQSNDGVSISYNVLSASEIATSTDSEAKKLIEQYLQGITNSLGYKLLYRGLYPYE